MLTLEQWCEWTFRLWSGSIWLQKIIYKQRRITVFHEWGSVCLILADWYWTYICKIRKQWNWFHLSYQRKASIPRSETTPWKTTPTSKRRYSQTRPYQIQSQWSLIRGKPHCFSRRNQGRGGPRRNWTNPHMSNLLRAKQRQKRYAGKSVWMYWICTARTSIMS